MTKFFEFLDSKMNIVRILQICAVAIFVLGFPHAIRPFFEVAGRDLDAGTIFSFVTITGMTIANMLYSPALLLGLAEIIKLMRVKNAAN